MDLLISLLSIAFAMILFLIPFVKPKPMKTLIIIRGIPGSGKSTLAAKMAAERGLSYFENDQFMIEPDGTYIWSQERLGRAIDQCFDSVHLKIEAGESVITAGVYARWRAMRDYVELAQKHGYEIQIIECTGDYGSIHGLTPERMDIFRQRFIPNKGLPQMQSIKYSIYP